MQKYYGQDIQVNQHNIQKRIIQKQNNDVGYFDYTDRGTREFMKGIFIDSRFI